MEIHRQRKESKNEAILEKKERLTPRLERNNSVLNKFRAMKRIIKGNTPYGGAHKASLQSSAGDGLYNLIYTSEQLTE